MPIRPLEPRDSVHYNTFFRAAVEAQPQFFRITTGDIDRSPFLIRNDEHGCTLLSEETQWNGVGTLERELGRERRAHIAWLVRMWVSAQGVGTGRLLMDALMARARSMPGIRAVNLTVLADNSRAISLYQSLGFKTFSHEYDAVQHGARLVNELTMAFAL